MIYNCDENEKIYMKIYSDWFKFIDFYVTLPLSIFLENHPWPNGKCIRFAFPSWHGGHGKLFARLLTKGTYDNFVSVCRFVCLGLTRPAYPSRLSIHTPANAQLYDAVMVVVILKFGRKYCINRVLNPGPMVYVESRRDSRLGITTKGRVGPLMYVFYAGGGGGGGVGCQIICLRCDIQVWQHNGQSTTQWHRLFKAMLSLNK